MEEVSLCVEELVGHMKTCLNNKSVGNPRESLASIQNTLVRLGAEMGDEFSREEAAAFLAQKRVAQTLAKFLQHLVWLMAEKNTFEVVQHIHKAKHMLYNVLLRLCDSAHEHLKLRLVSSSITKFICEDLKANRSLYNKNKVAMAIVQNGFGVLQKCVDVTKNVAKLNQQRTVDYLLPYTDPKHNYIHLVLCSVSLIEKLQPENQVHLFLYHGQFFTSMADMLSTSLYYDMTSEKYVIYPPSLKFSLQLDLYLSTISSLAKNDNYKCILLRKLKSQKDVFEELFMKGTLNQKDQLIAFLRQLCQHSCSKCSYDYIKALLFKYGIKVQTPITEVYLHCRSREDALHSSETHPCTYMGACKQFVTTLDIDELYVDRQFDRCFCQQCMTTRGDDEAYVRGNPPVGYILPKGFVKFALNTPQRAEYHGMWRSWHVAFHLTQTDSVANILHTSDLAQRDSTYDQRSGSRTSADSVEPVIVSPSLACCEQEQSCKPSRYEDPCTGKKYLVEVAFQVRVRPGSYTPAVPTNYTSVLASELPETGRLWSIDNCEDVVLVGLLVKLQPTDTTKL